MDKVFHRLFGVFLGIVLDEREFFLKERRLGEMHGAKEKEKEAGKEEATHPRRHLE
jgi:hypothetical protein